MSNSKLEATVDKGKVVVVARTENDRVDVYGWTTGFCCVSSSGCCCCCQLGGIKGDASVRQNLRGGRHPRDVVLRDGSRCGKGRVAEVDGGAINLREFAREIGTTGAAADAED